MKTLKQILEESNNKENKIAKINQFAILKPGFLDKAKEFCTLLNNNGWKIVQKKKQILTPDQVSKLYVNVSEKPFYNDLCDYMTSGECLCCSCMKECDNPIKEMCELKHKVREQWGTDDMRNAMHCSDSEENVINETKICMGESLCEAFVDNVTQTENVIPEQFNKDLVEMLQKAFAEEINAWYQYIIVAKFLHGNERKNIEDFYIEAAKDEFEDHAMWLLSRINELDSKPELLLDLYNINTIADHKYIVPDSYNVKNSLLLNIEAERGAIETYKKIEAYTRGIDVVTNKKIKLILQDEEEHLTELKDFLADII